MMHIGRPRVAAPVPAPRPIVQHYYPVRFSQWFNPLILFIFNQLPLQDVRALQDGINLCDPSPQADGLPLFNLVVHHYKEDFRARGIMWMDVFRHIDVPATRHIEDDYQEELLHLAQFTNRAAGECGGAGVPEDVHQRLMVAVHALWRAQQAGGVPMALGRRPQARDSDGLQSYGA